MLPGGMAHCDSLSRFTFFAQFKPYRGMKSCEGLLDNESAH